MQISKAIITFLEAKDGLSERTIDQYTRDLNNLKKLVGGELPGDMDGIKDFLKKATTIWTKIGRYNSLQAFYRWAHIVYKVENPMDLIPKPKIPEVEMRTLGIEDLARLIEAAQTPMEKAIVVLGEDCGIRASEFGKIRVEDVGQETVWIHGKGNRFLQVPISPETYYLLQNIIQHIPKRTLKSFLFTDSDKNPMSRFTIYRIVSGCFKRAGITGPKRGSHCLRHSLAMNYIANGGDIVSLNRVMRHRSINTTKKYVNLPLVKVWEFHNKFSPVRNAIYGVQGILMKEECFSGTNGRSNL